MSYLTSMKYNLSSLIRDSFMEIYINEKDLYKKG